METRPSLESQVNRDQATLGYFKKPSGDYYFDGHGEVDIKPNIKLRISVGSGGSRTVDVVTTDLPDSESPVQEKVIPMYKLDGQQSLILGPTTPVDNVTEGIVNVGGKKIQVATKVKNPEALRSGNVTITAEFAWKNLN